MISVVILCFGTDRSGQTVKTQISSLIRVYSTLFAIQSASFDRSIQWFIHFFQVLG